MSGGESYPLLEFDDFFVSHGVSLGYDRNQIDTSVQPSHELDIDLLEPTS